jgi:hypothetical protein
MATINIIPPEQKLLVISQSSQDNEIPTITTKLNISDNYTNKIYINYIEKGIPGSQGPIGPTGPAGNPIIGVDNYTNINSYLFKNEDNCRMITINNSSTCVMGLASDLLVGFQCSFVQLGTGSLYIADPTIINNNSYTTIQYKLNQLVKISNNQFLLFGEGA